MTSKTGASTTIIATKATTFGTAVAGTTGAKMEVESLNHTQNSEVLQASPIGSGLDMQNDAQIGAQSPSIDISKIAAYDDAGVFLEALFFGGNSVINMGSGAYHQSITYNATRNQYGATVAFQGHSLGVFEYPWCTPTALNVVADTPPDYVRHTINMLGNDRVISGTVNSAGSIVNATLANSKRVIVKPEDAFVINSQSGGALSGSDSVAVKSVTIQYNHDAEHVQEIKNSAGNGQVVSTGNPPFNCTLTVEFRNLNDFTYFTAQDAGTEYKAELRITGDLIGGSQYYGRTYAFPRLKILSDPEYNLTTPAENPSTVVFQALAASASPTGMINVLPYILVKNTKSTTYL